MQNEFLMVSGIIKEEFKKNSLKTLLKELSNICKSKNNKNQLKVLLIKIKIDIENTEINIIEKLGKLYNSITSPNNTEVLSNIKKSAVSSFTSSNSLNNSLIDKLCYKSSNNISNKSLYSNKYKSNCNSNENILKDLNYKKTDIIKKENCKNSKKRSNSHSVSNLIRVTKKLDFDIKNKIFQKDILEINHQIDFSFYCFNNNKNSKIIDYEIINKELAKEILEFIDNMKLLQENIIKKTPEVKILKYSFEKKKNILYQKAYKIYNEILNKNNLFTNNTVKNDYESIKINTNYFNKTLEMIKNNYENNLDNLKKENEILKNQIKIKENIEYKNDKIKSQHLDSIIKIYKLLLSFSQNNHKEKENKDNFEWYTQQIEDIINNIKLNNSNSQKIINISDLNKDILENENNTKEGNINITNSNSKNKEYIEIIDNIKDKEYNKQTNDNISINIIEMISLILPAINGCVEKEKENEVISKLQEDYKQQGIEFILYLLKSYIKQIINIIKEFQKQNNFRENSNSNTNKETNFNTNSSKENDNYMQNIQKKFIIIDRNSDKLFDDEKPNININYNLNFNNKGIKTPNQTIKNICKEIGNRSASDYKNQIYSILSTIQNNLFIKIETKDNEKLELDNKIKDLLRINKEIKNNILLKENNIFLKKYNLLNSLYNDYLEKTKILEIEYLTLIKNLCNFIQNGDKIVIKLEKIFNKYNNKDSIYNEQYDLELSNESDLLSSIEKVKNDEIFHFLNQNDKNKINDDLITKYKKENDNLNKCINEMKMILLTIGNNLNKLIKDKYIYNNYNDMFCALFKLLNYTDEQIKELL